jgi:HprK-related kinase B
MIKVSQLVEQYSPFFKIQFGIRNIPFTVLTNSVELDEMLRSYLNLWVNENTGEPGHVIYAIVGCIDIEYDKLVDIPRKANKTVKEAAYDSDQGTVILKKRTGVVVVRTENARYVVGNLILHMNQVVNVIDEVYITDYLQNGYVLLHSSSVVDTGGNSVVFTSESGSGKSTMAVAMLEHGYHYLSNDRTLIKVENDRVIIVGFPRNRD